MNHIQIMYDRITNKWIALIQNSNISEADKKKKITEICHVASFGIALWYSEIISSIEEIEIIESTEHPDFIIRFKEEIIGIELAQIKNARAQEIGSLKNILINSAKVFSKKYPDITILANIEFKEQSDIFSHDKESTYNTIADLVFYTHTRKNKILPYYIEHMSLMPYTDVTFELSGVYWVTKLDSEIVNYRIIEKEKKIDNYRKQSKLNKIWLLLIVSGASADSNYSYIAFEELKGSGQFESIYHINDVLKKVYKLNN